MSFILWALEAIAKTWLKKSIKVMFYRPFPFMVRKSFLDFFFFFKLIKNFFVTFFGMKFFISVQFLLRKLVNFFEHYRSDKTFNKGFSCIAANLSQIDKL